MERLGVNNGDTITISHLQPIASLKYVRAKMYKQELDDVAFKAIINDVVAGYYSNIEIAAFVSGCAGNNLSVNEITSLTKAMIGAGSKMNWDKKMILDKHCVGGLPSHRFHSGTAGCEWHRHRFGL